MASKYFEESLSLSSAVNLADRMYQEGDTVTRHEGTVEKGNVEVPSSFEQNDGLYACGLCRSDGARP
jgi:hypothetical protein